MSDCASDCARLIAIPHDRLVNVGSTMRAARLPAAYRRLTDSLQRSFDAGYAAALGKPHATLHDPGLAHALKEVDGAAQAVAET